MAQPLILIKLKRYKSYFKLTKSLSFRFSLDSSHEEDSSFGGKITEGLRGKHARNCHGRLIFTKKLGKHHYCHADAILFTIEN